MSDRANIITVVLENEMRIDDLEEIKRLQLIMVEAARKHAQEHLVPAIEKVYGFDVAKLRHTCNSLTIEQAINTTAIGQLLSGRSGP